MSFQIFNGVQGSPPFPDKKKCGVISFAYVSGTNDDISYLQLLGSDTIWVTGLAAAGTDIITLPSDANMIQLFDQEQVLVGCSRNINLYVNAKCSLSATTPSSITLPVAGMYSLRLTVISATGVYVSCEQISGGPQATSGNYISPLMITPAEPITAANLIPPNSSGELILYITAARTLPTATALYTAAYGTQTFENGMHVTCKIIVDGGGPYNLSRNGISTTFTAISPLGTPAGATTALAASTIYIATFVFTSATAMVVGGAQIGSSV